MNILSRFWKWLGSQPEDRAAVIHRNRSEGAKKAWQTRKARRSMAVKVEPSTNGDEVRITCSADAAHAGEALRQFFTPCPCPWPECRGTMTIALLTERTVVGARQPLDDRD